MTVGIFLFLDLLVLLITLLPLLPVQDWWSRAGEFPRLQIAFLAFVILAAQVFLLPPATVHAWLMHAAVLACLAYQLVWIVPYTPLFPKEVIGAPPDDVDAQRTVSVVVANVLMSNRNTAHLRRLVDSCDPDIVLLLETDNWWERQMQPLRETWPHGVDCPLDNRYGMHLYSRLQIENAEIKYLVDDDVPSIHAAVRLRSGDCIRFHAVHPTPPSPTENPTSRERDAELLVIGRAVSRSPCRVVVTGDFNDVAWSPTTRLFRKISRLVDPRIGRGMFSTFHAAFPLLRFPLDHVFHSDDFTLVALEVLPKFGSDHLPIHYRLLYQPAAEGIQEAPSVDDDDQSQASKRIGKADVKPDDVPDPEKG